jgi:hypothetical protein
MHQIIAQIPADWDSHSLPSVYSLLEYGSPGRPSAPHPVKTNSVWSSIMYHLVCPSTFFDLSNETYLFNGFTRYIISSPLVKTPDRLIFLSFTSALKSLEQALSQDPGKVDHTLASRWGLSLARQCGLMASCVERYQGPIAAVYRERGIGSPLADLDATLDRVLTVLSAFPVYVALANEAVAAFADLCRLVLAKSFAEPRTIETIAAYDSALEENAREQAQVVALEAEIRERMVAKYGKELGAAEAAAAIAGVRGQVRPQRR